MKKTLNQILYYFSLLLVIFLPFQSLLLSVLEDKFLLSSRASFWLTHWYEPVLVLIAILIISVTKVRQWKTAYLAIILALYGIISIALFSPSIGRGVEGFRFDLLFVLVFVLLAVSTFDKEKIKKLSNLYLFIAFLIAGWAIAERFLPPNYWANLGLSFHGYGYFGFGKFSFGVLNQSASFIGGPNQLGSYLLPAVFIVLNNLISSKVTLGAMKQFSNGKGRLATLQYGLLIILTIGVALSFSRSAWVGGFAGVIAYFVFYVRSVKVKYSILGALAVLLLGLFIAYKNIPAVKDLLLHTSAESGGKSSQEQHNSAWDSSIMELKSRSSSQLLFGTGIGTAGPIAIKYSAGIVSESWYMQLLLELGIIGLVLWIIFIGSLLVKSYRTHPGLFLGILAVSIAALFLHTWADNPSITVTLFILVGANWHNPTAKHSTN